MTCARKRPSVFITAPSQRQVMTLKPLQLRQFAPPVYLHSTAAIAQQPTAAALWKDEAKVKYTATSVKNFQMLSNYPPRLPLSRQLRIDFHSIGLCVK